MPIDSLDRSSGRGFAPGAVLRDRYELQGELGRGGMGIVYEGYDRTLSRKVAIKVVRDGANATRQARFLREAQLASRVQHPHTVYVIDFGSLPSGDCFLVMELLSGRTLAATLAECGSMPPLRACRIGAMIASGLHSVHEHGIVHRDLKPANVFLVEQEGGADFAKIVDFGVAKEVAGAVSEDGTWAGATPNPSDPATSSEEGPLTRPGSLVGTPRYMAPEQLRGEVIDARVDQYSLGCILYELLTSEPPFSGDVQQMSRGHLYGELTPPRKRAPQAGISADLEALILRAMARRREDRFKDMAQLAAALHAEIEHLLGRSAQQRPWPWPAIALAIGVTAVIPLARHTRSPRDTELPRPVFKAAPAPLLTAPPLVAPQPLPPAAAPTPVAAPPPAPPLPHGRPVVAAPRAAAEPRGNESPILIQGLAALERQNLSEAQRLFEMARSRCKPSSGTAAPETGSCTATSLAAALYLGRVHEAAGRWAEALGEYAHVLERAAGASDKALVWRAEAASATTRLTPRVGRVIFTRTREGRCEEVSMLLPPGEHQLEIDGQNQTITLRARETRRLGSCAAP